MEQWHDYSSKENISGLVNNNVRGVIANESEQAATHQAAGGVENENFQTAQKLREAKTKLIIALAQFPATALWLLNEYEQNRYQINPTDQTTKSAKKFVKNLENIKNFFLSACSGTGSYNESRQRLVSELAEFPYVFEDLVKLVDIVVFAYKYRGLCYQPSSSLMKNEAEVIIKRLEGAGRRTRLNAAKFSNLIKIGSTYYCDESFLFLTTTEMQGYFSDVVLSEHLWLNARQQLTNANSKLVSFIANQYKSAFSGFDDLVQEGQVGLIKAVDRFDHRLGFQFSTYAGYWIRQAISRALSRCERVVRVPCGQVANINKVFRAKEELFNKAGTEVSAKEVADYTGLTISEVDDILSISQIPMSLESFDDDDEENPFAPIDFLEQKIFSQPFAAIAEDQREKLIAAAIKSLNQREAKIICCHFGLYCDNEMTLQDIGLELNLTRERVRQIQVKALNKLKHSYGPQLMKFCDDFS